MDGYCLLNGVNKAKHIFNTMVAVGVAKDVHNYNIVVINGFCKSKMMDEALDLFEEMYSKNIIPTIVTYNTVIDGLCKSGRISYAWKLVREMRDMGQPADEITYNSFLHTFAKIINLIRQLH